MVEPGDELTDELRAALQREAQLQRDDPGAGEARFAPVEAALQGETGLRAWLSSRSTATRLTVMVVAIVATSLAVLRFSVRPDLASALGRVFSASLIYGCALVGALSVALRPLHRPGWPTGAARLALALGLGGAVGLALLPLATGQPLSSPGLAFAQGAMGCFVWGKSLSLPLLALGWLMQRGGSDLAARLLVTGGAAGLAGNLYLECHCPSQSPDHLLLGHVTVLLGMLLLGLLLSYIERRGRPRPS